MRIVKRPTERMKALLAQSAHRDRRVAEAAAYKLAHALEMNLNKYDSAEAITGEMPLRQGVLIGDNLANIFTVYPFDRGSETLFPLDFLAPGTEKEHVAYVVPNAGYVPHAVVEGDEVRVPTYDIAHSIDWNLKYSRDARWDVVSRAMEVLEAGFVKKTNDDGWHTILAAVVDRNIMVFDADANAGQFTKRLVSNMKVIMRRNGGGNATSLNRSRLTDIFMSPEALEDVRNWNIDQVPDSVRERIFNLSDDGLESFPLWGVTLHSMDEFGEGQEYQDFFSNTLSGTLASGDVELLVGLDLQTRKNSFVMPVVEGVTIHPDTNLLRRNMAGFWGRWEGGFACLDQRDAIAGSI